MFNWEGVNGGSKDEEEKVVMVKQPSSVGGICENKKKRTTPPPSSSLSFEVPYDIIRLILIASPQRTLFNKHRYVCKSWLNTITTDPDIPHNCLLPSNPPGIIIQTRDDNTTYFFKLPLRGTRVGVVTEEEFKRLDLTPCFRNLHIWACCNGIMLTAAYAQPPQSGPTTLYLVNPITNQRKQLPYISAPELELCTTTEKRLHYEHNALPSGFVFIPSTREYKVIVEVWPYIPDRRCHVKYKILTVISDTSCIGTIDSQWRCIQPPTQDVLSRPLAVDGILHWCAGDFLISFNATTETFCKRKLPAPQSSKTYRGFIDMGGVLSFWTINDHFSTSSSSSAASVQNPDQQLSVWILEDCCKGEWVRRYNICLHASTDSWFTRIYSFDDINGEVILRRTVLTKCVDYNSTVVAYNLKSQQHVTILSTVADKRVLFFGPHTGSVVATTRLPFLLESKHGI